MIKKLIPIVLVLVGAGAGLGAGLFLRPTPDPETEDQAAIEEVVPEELQPDYVKLNNQFVVPVLENGKVSALVIMALSLEVAAGMGEQVYAKEPKLRDAFLQVLFNHANAGGFRGSFTDSANMVLLRKALQEAAETVLGDQVTDVLIADFARQDA